MPSTPTAWLIVAAGRIELAGDHVAGPRDAFAHLLGGTVNSRYWTLAKRPPPPWPDESVRTFCQPPAAASTTDEATRRGPVPHTARSISVGLQAPRRGARGCTLPRPFGVASCGKSGRRPRGGGFRI
jgi:hypothetical protein